jgi:hypothetical protein
MHLMYSRLNELIMIYALIKLNSFNMGLINII